MEASNEISAFCSHAYETLTSDLERTVYYLKLRGLDVLQEESKASPNLIMQVFAIREEIEDAHQETELDPIQMEMNFKYSTCFSDIQALIQQDDLSTIESKVQELKYYHNILHQIDLKRDQLADRF